MKVIVFCGPTIQADEVRRQIDAEVRPPAARGDVLRAALENPVAIALVDGYFHRVPSVWHKEILWAMAKGIHVLGSSSMGALRAAELASFGMEGFGAVFEGFASGSLSDDDEVAVLHAPAEQGYRPLSEALVNIRATLAEAERVGALSAAHRASIERAAKRLPYPERSYPALLAPDGPSGVPAADLERLRGWLPGARVDQKRRDALAMLSAIRERQRSGWKVKTVDYCFANTHAWNALVDEVSLEAGEAGGGAHGARGVREELLASGRLEQAYAGALGRVLALEYARRTRLEPDALAVSSTAEDFRRERGLLGAEQFDGWLEAQGLRAEDVDAYFTREAAVRRIDAAFRAQAAAHIVDDLRSSGDYQAIAGRAEAKQRELAARGLKEPELQDTGLAESELWRWYFVEQLGREHPIDPRAHAQRERTDLDTLRAAVIREYCYLRILRERER